MKERFEKAFILGMLIVTLVLTGIVSLPVLVLIGIVALIAVVVASLGALWDWMKNRGDYL